MEGNAVNKFSPTTSNHSRLWVASLAVLIILATFILLIIFMPRFNAKPDYGIFLDSGLLDVWEFNNGRATFSIVDDQERTNDYSIYMSDQTRVMKAVYLNKNKPDERTLQPGDINEITDGVFAEIYLQNSYENIVRVAKTIIYWE